MTDEFPMVFMHEYSDEKLAECIFNIPIFINKNLNKKWEYLHQDYLPLTVRDIEIARLARLKDPHGRYILDRSVNPYKLLNIDLCIVDKHGKPKEPDARYNYWYCPNCKFKIVNIKNYFPTFERECRCNLSMCHYISHKSGKSWKEENE